MEWLPTRRLWKQESIPHSGKQDKVTTEQDPFYGSPSTCQYVSEAKALYKCELIKIRTIQ